MSNVVILDISNVVMSNAVMSNLLWSNVVLLIGIMSNVIMIIAIIVKCLYVEVAMLSVVGPCALLQTRVCPLRETFSLILQICK